MTAQLSPTPVQKFFDANGLPLVSGKVFTYIAGTSTKQASYLDSTQVTPNTNPVILNARGESVLWLDPTKSYKIVLAPATDTDPPTNAIWTSDNILGPFSSGASIIPSIDNTYTLGSPSVSWANVYVGVNHAAVLDTVSGNIGYYARTAAEIAAAVTPTNYSYPPGYITRYGADPTGVADSTTAIQNAIYVTNAVYIPEGTFKVTSQINVKTSGGAVIAGFKISGAGKTRSWLKASGVFNAIFNVGLNGTQTIRGVMQDFGMTATGATVQYGIYGSNIEEQDYTRLAAWFFQIAGISTGYGYVNNFFECDCSYNTGDGIYLNKDFGAANNAVTITNCLLLSNTGFGVRGSGGRGIWITQNTIEQNAAGGIYLDLCSDVRINSYFESNALNGYTFVTPAITVKADIIITGAGNFTTLSAAFPSVAIDIGPCNTLPRAGGTAFFFNGGAVDVSVHNVYTFSPTFVPCVAEHYNPAYKGQNTRIDNCSTFTVQVNELSASAGINNSPAAYFNIETPSINLERRNYATWDMIQWALLAGGAASTWRRSQTAALKRLYQTDVWEMNSTAAGSSNIFGISLNATDYPELIGQLMWHGIWVYITDVNCYALPYNNQQSFNNNPTALNTWTFLAVSFVWPGAGTVDTGVRKSGTTVNGSVFVAAPMIAPVGVPHDVAISTIPYHRTWLGTATPVAGTWDAGDIIQDTAGLLRFCTVSGTPGTWAVLTVP